MNFHRGYIVLAIALFFIACNKDKRPRHYFLDGYDQLTFQNRFGQFKSPRDFISARQINGVALYQVIDTSLTLVYRKDLEPYTGYIRTYHWDMYNIEGVFEEGKIKRLRFWHPNRQLGMDEDFVTRSGQAWNFYGVLALSWSGGEQVYWNLLNNTVKEIRTDTLVSYFDEAGSLTRYTVVSDSTVITYRANGIPITLFPVRRGGRWNGVVKRWHENGELRVIGEYRNGEEYGTWIEYDSTGREISREVYN